jgi:hypothetical protein
MQSHILIAPLAAQHITITEEEHEDGQAKHFEDAPSEHQDQLCDSNPQVIQD